MASEIRDLINRWEDEPGNLDAFQELEAAYAESGNWRDIMELYKRGGSRFKDVTGFGDDLVDYLALILDELDDKQEENRLLVALGDAYMHYVGDREEAMKAYQNAFKTYPYDTECLDRARAIYRRDGDFDRVLLLYKLELKVKTDSRPRADTLLRMAQVHGDDKRDLDRALGLIEQAQELVPEHELAHELRQVYENKQTVYGVVTELVRDAKQVAGDDPSEASELLVRAAQIEWDREAGNPETAAEYAEAAFRHDSRNEEAKALLGELFRELGRESELADGNGAGVEMMAPVQLEQSEGEGGPSDASSELDVHATQRLSAVQLEGLRDEDSRGSDDEGGGEDGDEEEINPNKTLALEPISAPEDDELEDDELEAIDAPENDDDSDVDEAREADEVTEDQEERETAENESAEADAAASEHPNERPTSENPAAAPSEVSDDLGEDPSNLVALRAFKAQKLEEGDVDAVIEQYTESLGALRREEGEAEVMADLASLYWHEKEDWEQAEYYYKRLKLLEHEHEEMKAFYEAYYEREGEWRKLSAMLSSAAQNVDEPEEKLEITRRLASLGEGSMESPKTAIDAWKAYLREVSDSVEAIQELRRLYQQEEKWSAYADLLKDDLKRLDEDGSPEERLEVLDELVTVYEEKLGLEPMVILTLQEIVSLDPLHPGAFDKLRDLLQKGRRFNDLAQLMEDRADAAAEAGDLGTATELLLEVADIWQERLKNVTQALPHLERVLELDPDNQDVVARLEAIYEQRRDYASLFDLRRRQASRLEGAARLERLRELAVLAEEKIRDPNQIAPILEEVVDADPGDLETLDKLDNIYLRIEAWSELVSVLERKLELVDQEKVADLHDRMGRILLDRLDEEEKAVENWRQVLSLEPNHSRAIASLTEVWIANESFDDLDALYRERGDLDRLYDMLDSAAATNEDAELKRSLYRRMATLAQDDLEDVDRVIISLESLREVTEDEADVARELLGWYEKTEDLGQQVAMHQVLLEHADEADRFAILERLRALEAERGDLEGALDLALRAIVERPTDEDAYEAAVRMGTRAETFAPIVDTLEEIAQSTDDDSVRALSMERAGRLLIDSGDHERAATYFEALREDYPEEPRYLSALETVYGALGDSSKRLSALREQIRLLGEQGASNEDMVDELSKVADIQRTELDEPEAARETYREILDIDPEHLGSLRGLKALFRQGGDWVEVTDMLLRELGVLELDDEAGRLGVQMELADVYRLHLDESAEALRYYGQILTEDPQHEKAVSAVESMLADDSFARDAALLLEPIFRESGNYEALARALEARRRVADDRFEEAEILDELIPIYIDELDQQKTAFERAYRQFELDPDRQEIWLRLEQLGARQNRWHDLEEVFSRHAPDEHNTTQTRFDLLRHLAAIREHQLGMKEEALAAWETLHANDPFDLANVEALERLHRALAHHGELVDALEKKAELLEDVEEKAAALSEAARIADEVVADAPRTVHLYREVLLIEQDHLHAVSRIRSILRDEENWVDLEDHLVQQADFATDPKARKSMQLETAQVRWRHLEDMDGAADLLRMLLAEHPDDRKIVDEVEALDDALAERGDRGDLRLDLAELVEPFHRAAGNVGPLVDVLDVKLEATSDPFDRVRLLDEKAELQQMRQGRPEAAFASVAEAVRLMPDEVDRRERFEHLAEQLGEDEIVVDTYRDAAVDANDPYVAAELLTTAGEWLEKKLNRPQEAIEAYEGARERNESSPDILQALDRLYLAVGDHEMLAENLRRRTIHGDPGQRADFLRRLANIEDEILGRPEEAIDAWLEVMEMEPSADDAVAALERLYETESRWLDLAEILIRKASAAIEPGAQTTTLHRLAELREDELDDIQAAIQTYNEILAVDPTDTKALGELERLYRRELQWADLADVLRRMLEVETVRQDAELVTRIELDLAGVLAKELFEPDAALEIYRRVLERQPNHPEAVSSLEELARDDAMLDQVAEDLIPAFVSGERWDDLIDLYDRLQEKAVDPFERAKYFYRIAQVQMEGEGDMAAALDSLAQAWRLDVEQTSYRDEILSVASELEAWERLAEIYRDTLTEMNDPERMLDTRMRLAALQRDQLEDRSEAELSYREALVIDDRHAPAYDALEQLLSAQERWHDLIDVLEGRYNAIAVDEPENARLTLFRIASVQEDLLNDGFSAVETYQRVLDLEPDDSDAHEAVVRLFRAQERWEDLASLLQSSLGMLEDSDRRRARMFELAEIQRSHLMNEALALDFYREILTDDLHDGALAAVETLFADETSPVRYEAAQLLEPIYRRQDAWQNLTDVLMALARPDELDGGNLALLTEAAEIVEDHLDDPVRAFELRGAVVRAAPEDAQARASLEHLTATNQKWPALAEVYSDVLRDNISIGDDVRIELQLGLAEIQEGRLGQIEEARQTLENVVALDPENEAALDSLERIYSRQADWSALGELYRRRADLSTMPDERRKWLEHLANLYEEVVEDPQSAIDVYIELTEIDPDDRSSRRALERLLQRGQRWHDLADLYRNQAETAEDPHVARERRFRLAQLMESELEQLDEALDIYESILVEDPRDFETRRALTGLERDLEVRDGDWSDYRIRIIDLLIRMMEAPRDREGILALLESKEKLVRDVDEKVKIFVRMADLMEGAVSAEDKALALNALANAFRIEPRNKDLADRITMLAQETDAWERLLPVYLSGLEITDDPDVQVSLLAAIAKIYSGPMNDQGSAISAYQQVIEIEPDHDEALGQLQRLYGELELWGPLIEILEARLEAVYDGDVQRALLERIGRIYREVLEEPEKAVDKYERLREIDPSDTRYTLALDDLYREAQRWEDLEVLLREKVATVTSPEERAGVWRDLARVQETMLGHKDDAIDSYRAILDENPDDTDAIHALSRLYEEVERWPELLDILQVERDFAAGIEELNAVEIRTGNILFDRLDAPFDAMQHYRAVLERDPTHPDARQAMTRLLKKPETRGEAMELLEETMRSAEEWREVESLIERALELVSEREARRSYYAKLARLQEDEIATPQLAFVTYGRALREFPDDSGFIEALERLSVQLANKEELIAVYEDCVEGADADPHVLRDLHARLGDLYMELEQNDEAIRHWEDVMELDEYDAEALDALDQLYQMEGRYQELVHVLERAVATVDPDRIARVRYRLGYLKEVIFEEPEEAFSIYSEVLAEEPRHENTLEAMERLVGHEHLRLDAARVLEDWYLENEDWEKLENLYQLKLEVLDDPIDRAQHLEKIADIQIERFDRFEIGYAYLCRALSELPSDTDVQERLESLVHVAQMYEDLVALYEEIIEEIDDPMRIVELGVVAADLLVERLERPERAAQIYERVLNIDAENDRALAGLETIARNSGDSEQLIAVLRRKADVVFDPEKQRDVYVELGRVYGELEHFDEGIEALRQALLVDESDVEIMKLLVEYLEITERYEELVEQLQRLASFASDEEERFRVNVRIGQISRVLLGDNDRSISAYEDALALEPKSTEVLQSLRELYELAERWDQLREILLRLVPITGDTDAKVAILVQLARVSYERFNEVERAVDSYRQALALKPGNRSVFKALDELLRAEARWGEVLSLYENAIAATPTADVDRQVQLQVEMADVSAKHLGDLDGAITYLTNLLEADPNHVGALRVLSGLYGETGDVQAQESTLARMLQAAKTNDELAEAHAARGDLYRSRDMVSEAAGDYVKVLEYEPTNAHALEALREIYEGAGAWGELFQIIDFEAAYANSEDRKLELHLEAADVARDKIGNHGMVVEALEKARAIKDDLDVLEPLLDAYISAGRVELAEPLLEAIIDNLTSERRMKDVVRFYHLQGKLAEQKGDEDAAHEAYLAAHKIDASYIPNLISLGKLLYRRDELDEALKIFQTLLLHQMSIHGDDQKVDVYYHLGMVRLRQGDPRRAKDMFNRALNIDSEHGPSRQALQQI